MQKRKRAWSTLVQTAEVEVRGEVVVFRKEGALAIAETVCSIPVLGDLIESVVSAKMKAKDGKIDAEVVKAAVAKTAAADDVDMGKVARDALTALPEVVSTLISRAAVMEDEEEREDFRGFVRSLDLTELFDVLAAWVNLNFPQVYGPFVAAAAKIVLFVENLGKDEPAPEIAPEALEAAAA